MRQADLDSIRRFFRDDLFHSVDKMLQFPISIKVAGDNVHEGVMEALQWAACVAAGALQYRAQLDPADVVPSDLDADLVPVAQSMLQLFNQHKNLHCQVSEYELPPMLDIFEGRLPDHEYARPLQPDLEDLGEGDDPDAPVYEKHRWLAALINTFAGFQGFEAIVKVGSVQQPLVHEHADEQVAVTCFAVMAATSMRVLRYALKSSSCHPVQQVTDSCWWWRSIFCSCCSALAA